MTDFTVPLGATNPTTLTVPPIDIDRATVEYCGATRVRILRTLGQVPGKKSGQERASELGQEQETLLRPKFPGVSCLQQGKWDLTPGVVTLVIELNDSTVSCLREAER